MLFILLAQSMWCVCVHILCLHSVICDSYFNIHLISPLPSLHLLKLLFHSLPVFVYYCSSSVCCVCVCTCIDIELQVSANPSCNMIHTASLILQLCMSLLLPLGPVLLLQLELLIGILCLHIMWHVVLCGHVWVLHVL